MKKIITHSGAYPRNEITVRVPSHLHARAHDPKARVWFVEGWYNAGLSNPYDTPGKVKFDWCLNKERLILKSFKEAVKEAKKYADFDKAFDAAQQQPDRRRSALVSYRLVNGVTGDILLYDLIV